MSCHGSMEPSGTRKARRIFGLSAGSFASRSATLTSSQSTPLALQLSANAVT